MVLARNIDYKKSSVTLLMGGKGYPLSLPHPVGFQAWKYMVRFKCAVYPGQRMPLIMLIKMMISGLSI